MKRYISISVAFVAILLMGLGKDDHKHTWVTPVEDTVRVEYTTSLLSSIYYSTSGWKKGSELVCIKCFQRKTQMIDYGQPDHGNLIHIPTDSSGSELFDKTLLKGSSQ